MRSINKTEWLALYKMGVYKTPFRTEIDTY